MMEYLNLFLSFPGKITALVISTQLGWIGFIFFAGGLYLIQYGIIRQDRNFSGLGLVMVSVLLAFFPFFSGHGNIHNPVFWGSISLSALTGFLFYFLYGDQLEEPAREGSGVGSAPAEKEVEADTGFRIFDRKYLLVFSLILALLAVYFRAFQIEQYPPGYSFWELDNSYDVVKYDSGKLGFSDYMKLWGIKEVGLASHSPILMGLSYPFFKILGISLSTGRYFSLVLGVSGLVFLFLYLKTQFSVRASIFLMSFVSLGLIHIAFSRAGLQNITAVFYGAFVLWMMEVLIKARKAPYAVLSGFAFGAVLFGSLYMYLATRVIIFAVVGILFLKSFFVKGFFRENLISLAGSGASLFILLYIYIDGNFNDLWPNYATYIHPGKSPSYGSFISSGFETVKENILPTFDRIVFSQRSIDSFSSFSQGGLVVEPVLCLLPFALGYLAAGAVHRIRYLALAVVLGAGILPAILSGVPNARRLLFFLSILLILPGLTFFIQHELIQRILRPGKKKVAFYISITLIFGLFSHNLYVFLDIYKNMKKQTSVVMPFAESGFMDIRYSSFLKGVAQAMKEAIAKGDVFYYYSNVYDENATAPNGAPEQFIIETHENAKAGGRLVWMNQLYEGYQPFRDPNKKHYFGFNEAVRMIQASSGNVHLFFIKPMADERGIFNRLRLLYPGSKGLEIKDEGEDNVYLVLSLTAEQIKAASGGDSETELDPIETVFSLDKIHHLIQKGISENLPWKESFLVQEDSEVIFRHFSPELLDIYLDGKKLDGEIKKIILFKGIHEVEVRPSEREPFTFLRVSETGAEKLTGPVFLPPSDLNFMQSEGVEEFDLTWKAGKIERFKVSISPHTFFMKPDRSYWYSEYGQIFDPLRKSRLENEHRTITNIREFDGKMFITRAHVLFKGWLTVYDNEFKKLKDFETKPYPLDLFLDRAGNVYITHIKNREILQYSMDGTVETWDTSGLSNYPIWNGAVDENGDFVLLSAGGEVLVLDPGKQIKRRFYADTSWRTFHAAIRDPGGLVISRGIIHILDGNENTIKSYSKTGKRLYNPGKPSLFDLPVNFKIDFIQKVGDEIILINRDFGGRFIVAKPESFSGKNLDLTKLLLTEIKPVDFKVGWGDLQINEKGVISQRIAGEKVENFLFAHAPSRVSYFLRGNFRKFSFGFGLDDVNADDKGSVRFVVKGDGRTLFSSPVVRALKPIERRVIDVSGVVKLELIAESTDDGNPNDEALWVNPVLEY